MFTVLTVAAVPVQIDLVPFIAALVTALGGGAGIAKFIQSIWKVRAGMSARESKRKLDIIQQRDHAIKSEHEAWDAYDEEARKKRAAQEEVARLRLKLIDLRVDPGSVMPIEDTSNNIRAARLRSRESETQ